MIADLPAYRVSERQHSNDKKNNRTTQYAVTAEKAEPFGTFLICLFIDAAFDVVNVLKCVVNTQRLPFYFFLLSFIMISNNT